MKRICLTLFLSFILLSSAVFADGGAFVKRPSFETDIWIPINQDEQVAVISYENGKETLTISVEAELENGEIVWLFPVPAKPELTDIDIVDEFPRFSGDEVRSRVGYEFNRLSPIFYITQSYPINIGLFSWGTLGSASSIESAGQDIGVEIHEHIEFGGLTTELVTAEDENSLYNYMQQKGLKLPAESLSILEEYIGKDYSFVVSWISDGLAYQTQAGGNVLGVEATFQTNEMFYPLRLTSIYGQTEIPMTIYIYGHVSPKVFSEISDYTEVNYYRGDVDYTRIDIFSQSRFFVDDLWISGLTPPDIIFADIILISPAAFFAVVFVLASIISSILTGFFFYRKKFSMKKFALLGLANLLTIFGFSIAAAIKFKTKKKHDLKMIPIAFGLIILVFAISLLARDVLLFYISLIVLSVSFVIPVIVLGGERLLAFVISFSIVFLILTSIASTLVLSAYPYVMSYGMYSIESAKNLGCMIYVTHGCENWNNITLDMDANGNGRTGDRGDTMKALFETYYGCGDETCARQICNCPGY